MYAGNEQPKPGDASRIAEYRLGKRGDAPSWYEIDLAAVRYHLSPVEAEELPGFWIKAAAAAELGESLAKAEWELRLRS